MNETWRCHAVENGVQNEVSLVTHKLEAMRRKGEATAKG